MKCPECDAELNIPEDTAVGEIVSCSDCGADYEISKSAPQSLHEIISPTAASSGIFNSASHSGQFIIFFQDFLCNLLASVDWIPHNSTNPLASF